MSDVIFTDDNFEEEVLNSSIPVFVDFWAPWCGPCQQMSPMVEELASEFDMTKIKIGKMNCDDNSVTPGKYNIMSIPSFLIFKNGEVVGEEMGGMPKDRLKAFIEKYI